MKGWTPYGLFLVFKVAFSLWGKVIPIIYELDPALQLNTHHKNTWEMSADTSILNIDTSGSE
jgi:hypothetical protein